MIRRLALAALLTATLAPTTAWACPTHEVTVPTGPGNGKPREVKELLDTPFVKLVSITLRDGTKLSKHKVGQAITLQAIAGSGKVTVDKTVDTLGPGRVVLIGPGAEHEIVPDGKAELVLLVTFLPLPGGDAGKADAAAASCTHEGHGEAGHKH